MMSWSACLRRNATDLLGPHQSARPTASYTTSWDSIRRASNRIRPTVQHHDRNCCAALNRALLNHRVLRRDLLFTLRYYQSLPGKDHLIKSLCINIDIR